MAQCTEHIRSGARQGQPCTRTCADTQIRCLSHGGLSAAQVTARQQELARQEEQLAIRQAEWEAGAPAREAAAAAATTARLNLDRDMEAFLARLPEGGMMWLVDHAWEECGLKEYVVHAAKEAIEKQREWDQETAYINQAGPGY